MSAVDASQQEQPGFLSGVCPYLQVDGALAASAFYQRAFGAQQLFCHPPDEQGRTMHLHLNVNGSSVILCDPYPEHGHGLQPPQGFHLLLQVRDIDAWFKRAVDAGCTVVMPIARMFWGDRYAQVRDPYGIVWAMNDAS